MPYSVVKKGKHSGWMRVKMVNICLIYIRVKQVTIGSIFMWAKKVDTDSVCMEVKKIDIYSVYTRIKRIDLVTDNRVPIGVFLIPTKGIIWQGIETGCVK